MSDNSNPDDAKNLTPWLGLIPFFEHANIADPDSRNLSMKQLAAKVVHCLAKLPLETLEYDEGAERHTGYLLYACAFDHTGCNRDKGDSSTAELAVDRANGKTLAGMVDAWLTEEASRLEAPKRRAKRFSALMTKLGVTDEITHAIAAKLSEERAVPVTPAGEEADDLAGEASPPPAEVVPGLLSRVIMNVDEIPPSDSKRANLIKAQQMFTSCRLPDVIEALYRRESK